jgi:hypothetical protein
MKVPESLLEKDSDNQYLASHSYELMDWSYVDKPSKSYSKRKYNCSKQNVISS